MVRGFLARQQVTYMNGKKIVCQYIFKNGKNTVTVTVKDVSKNSKKKKKYKYKLIAQNYRKKRQDPIIMKITDLPIDVLFIKEYL
jgi:hypothetical protein